VERLNSSAMLAQNKAKCKPCNNISPNIKKLRWISWYWLL